MESRLPTYLVLSALVHALVLGLAPGWPRAAPFGPFLQATLAAPGSSGAPVSPSQASGEGEGAEPPVAAPGAEAPTAMAPAAPPSSTQSQQNPPAVAEPPPPAYYAPGELDRRASVIGAPELPLPTEEVPPGRVRLRLFLSARGEVERIEVEENTLPAAFVDLLRGQYARLRFTPAQRRGQSVPSWMRLEVVYEAQPAH